jgi:hypothetical protein
MKKILFSGMGADVTEERVRQDLGPVGPVRNVLIIRDGDPNRPVVLVTMDIDDKTAGILVSRVQSRWHNGHLITARLMHDHAE